LKISSSISRLWSVVHVQCVYLQVTLILCLFFKLFLQKLQPYVGGFKGGAKEFSLPFGHVIRILYTAVRPIINSDLNIHAELEL